MDNVPQQYGQGVEVTSISKVKNLTQIAKKKEEDALAAIEKAALLAKQKEAAEVSISMATDDGAIIVGSADPNTDQLGIIIPVDRLALSTQQLSKGSTLSNSKRIFNE